MYMQFIQEWIEETESTNDYLKRKLSQGSGAEGLVVAAKKQVTGHGRDGRLWISEPGKDLTFSVALRVKASPEELPSLPMAIALSIRETLDSQYQIQAEVKWPNDVMVHGKKICGIISEALFDHKTNTTNLLVVGIGLNVGMSLKWLENINQPATSMSVVSGISYTVTEVLDRILERLPKWLSTWESSGFRAIQHDWLLYERRLHTHIRVGHGHKMRQGILTGYGPNGELLLRDDQGYLHSCVYGDMQAEDFEADTGYI